MPIHQLNYILNSTYLNSRSNSSCYFLILNNLFICGKPNRVCMRIKKYTKSLHLMIIKNIFTLKKLVGRQFSNIK